MIRRLHSTTELRQQKTLMRAGRIELPTKASVQMPPV